MPFVAVVLDPHGSTIHVPGKRTPELQAGTRDWCHAYEVAYALFLFIQTIRFPGLAGAKQHQRRILITSINPLNSNLKNGQTHLNNLSTKAHFWGLALKVLTTRKYGRTGIFGSKKKQKHKNKKFKYEKLQDDKTDV